MEWWGIMFVSLAWLHEFIVSSNGLLLCGCLVFGLVALSLGGLVDDWSCYAFVKLEDESSISRLDHCIDGDLHARNAHFLVCSF